MIGPFSTTLVPLSSSSSVDRQILINEEASAISPDERTFGLSLQKYPSQGVRMKKKKKRIEELGPDRPYFQFVCIPPPKKYFSTSRRCLKIWNLRVQKNLNIEKIAFRVVQMKFLAMHIMKFWYIYGRKRMLLSVCCGWYRRAVVIFICFAYKKLSRRFIKFRLNPRWTILTMLFILFWTLTVRITNLPVFIWNILNCVLKTNEAFTGLERHAGKGLMTTCSFWDGGSGHTHTHTWSSGHTHTPGAVDTHTHLEQWTHTHTPGAVDTHTHLEQWTHTHTWSSGHTHTHTWRPWFGHVTICTNHVTLHILMVRSSHVGYIVFIYSIFFKPRVSELKKSRMNEKTCRMQWTRPKTRYAASVKLLKLIKKKIVL